jgi:membrane fusion protein (multidrug efflux system)
LALAILAVAGAVSLWIYFSQFESTDDAYITGHEHPVSFRVPGTISEVLVDDNQLMKKGDRLLGLTQGISRVALAQARANHLQAKLNFESKQAHRSRLWKPRSWSKPSAGRRGEG